jgi:hypothetical protein
MKLIVHHFWKDVRLLRWLLGLWILIVVVDVVLACLSVESDYARAHAAYQVDSSTIFYIAGAICWTLLLVRLVQSEPMGGTTSFWRTRPTPPWVMIPSKISFVALLLVLPSVLLHFLSVALYQLSPSDTHQIVEDVIVLDCLVVPVIVWLAAQTRSLTQFWIVVCILAVAFSVYVSLSFFHLEGFPSDPRLNAWRWMAGSSVFFGGILISLFVVTAIGRKDVHPGHLADVYLNCGCFAAAKDHYVKPEHPRKLGDICWAQGDFAAAEAYYSKAKSEAQSYRCGPDEDRLIKLAFFQSQWELVVERFARGSFSKGMTAGKIFIGNSETSASPYLDMLAVALAKLEMPTPVRALDRLNFAFEVNKREWDDHIAKPIYRKENTVSKLRNACYPKKCARETLTVDEAARRGGTARARHVTAYIENADVALEQAQNILLRFADTGDDATLEAFIMLVTGSGIMSMSHSFLFSAFGHDSFTKDDVPPERLIRLYSSHSVMNKRHFGKLLDLRFKNRLPLTADEVLTGLFQHIGRISTEAFNFAKLTSAQAWARIRLEEWIRKRGSVRADEVAETWREGRAQPTAHPFYAGIVQIPTSPRNMKEWYDLMDDAARWLARRWQREIGNTRWIAENQLFQVLRRSLKGVDVQQHARPTWIEPQHLDVYVPTAGIAVEYMGQQHFEPLEFFGGEKAFQEVVARDRRKAQLCEANGVRLSYVRFDEDIGHRARELVDLITSLIGKPASKSEKHLKDFS